MIHEADAPLLRSRRAHVQDYLDVRQKYLRDPEGEAKQTAAAEAVISGEMEPTTLLKGGETLSLGGDVTVFVGDAVQVHGAATDSPGTRTRPPTATPV
ncbi:hypothetical protein [Actinomadura sp. 3N508]|uniref:hypothetical protein n=1 Tax=Actinomadura sp. 3N508 TaxID=3375153 RepID=UPI003795FBC4